MSTHVAWHYKYSHLLALALFVTHTSCDSLVFVQVVHRHGDRGPVLIAPGFAEKWAELNVTAGQLTKIGVAQQEAFGSFLRQVYHESLALSETYHPSEISVRATESDRTIGSAYALLGGLYPAHTVPIPVYTVPERDDFESRFWSNCPSWYTWMEGIDDLMSPIIAEELDLDFLNTELQFNSTSMSKTMLMGMMYDNLACMDAHGIPSTLSKLKRFQVTSMAKRAWYAQYVGAYQENQRGPAAQELIRAFAENARNAVDGSQTQKLKFYSAHDNTLVGLHDALGLFHEDGNSSALILPGYSNSIIFELWKEQDKHTIRIKHGAPYEGESDMEWFYGAQPLAVIGDTQNSYSYSPDLDSWLDYVDSLPPYEEGCCLKEAEFERRGCATSNDNTDHSSDDVCRKYQEYCPTTACGDDFVFSQPLDQCLVISTTPTDFGNESSAPLENTVHALSIALAVVIVCFLGFGVYWFRIMRKHRAYAGLDGIMDTTAAPDYEAEDIGVIDNGLEDQEAGIAEYDLEKVALTRR